ncbi:MAG: hypothetical protein O3C65_09515 [Proteobacteria bacterium]|nr:hypothetical protein [Pseudomonadota bacterium]MDA1058913.1 hypothetical protein [Pseudomonadota bacterium]
MADDKGMLVSWTETNPTFDTELREWFVREHIDERALDTPGFYRARFYDAVDAKVEYFATYETENYSVLTGAGYGERVGNQTEWSRKVIPQLAVLDRMTARLTIDMMHGVGGAVAAVRFFPPQDDAGQKKLRDHLRDTVFAPMVKLEGVVGVCLAENILEAANATGAKARALGGAMPVLEKVEWLAVIEASTDQIVRAAARDAFGPEALNAYGVESAPQIGLYRFVYGMDKRGN